METKEIKIVNRITGINKAQLGICHGNIFSGKTKEFNSGNIRHKAKDDINTLNQIKNWKI